MITPYITWLVKKVGHGDGEVREFSTTINVIVLCLPSLLVFASPSPASPLSVHRLLRSAAFSRCSLHAFVVFYFVQVVSLLLG
ncbi:hypothetical protein E2C01_043591 [Portunus trituberculatus]|uniref:Uncharacterized protein n=1 Tax=Portunus trituberculatus TaxID=210409 RepID=A0A5B7FWH9_PORTR|nr:hypothetical protein [Portunus trituberculatus]